MTQTETARTAKVGDTLPIFQRTTGFHHWNRYAAVNDEFVPLHMDDEAGRAAGFPTAFGMGNLQFAYMHNMIRNWIGAEGSITRIGCQFRSVNTRGMTVTTRGVVTAIREGDGTKTIDLDVWTEDDDGNKLAPGTATVTVRT